MSTLLEMKDMRKAFGAIVVADELSLTVPKGQVLGVIGPNGAGKTSMFNLITGTLQSDGGSLIFEGKDITRKGAPGRARAGIARSFQVPQPFTGMSVFENTLVAATVAGNMPIHEANFHCVEVLEKIGLIDKANRQAGALTLLERKRLELARAMTANPRLLLLDEIAGGLTERECQSLVETIKQIARSGVTIIWIEHVVHALLAVVERLVVLDFGRLIADGEPKAVMETDMVREIYMGIEIDA